jgi:hypothetical protein
VKHLKPIVLEATKGRRIVRVTRYDRKQYPWGVVTYLNGKQTSCTKWSEGAIVALMDAVCQASHKFSAQKAAK